MERKMTKGEFNKMCRAIDIISALRDCFDEEPGLRDIPLNFGNGSVYEQLGCSLAALDCIYKERHRIVKH